MPGTPFDFFAFREGKPYIIELKSSVRRYNLPGRTQRLRMESVLRRVPGLHVALLQIKLAECEYRLLLDREVWRLFRWEDAPLQPILEWLRERI